MPIDRAQLADALASADAATLRRLSEERAILAELVEAIGTPDAAAQANDHRIVAALVLAVAEAALTSDVRIEQAGRADYCILDIPMPETHTMAYGVCELTGALAALLEGA